MPETVGDFLKEHSLSKYADAFEEHGWDSLSYLQAISDDDLKQLIADVAMPSGHAARLRTETVENGVSRTRHIFWKPGTVSGRTAHWRKPGQFKWMPATCGPVEDVSP